MVFVRGQSSDVDLKNTFQLQIEGSWEAGFVQFLSKQLARYSVSHRILSEMISNQFLQSLLRFSKINKLYKPVKIKSYFIYPFYKDLKLSQMGNENSILKHGGQKPINIDFTTFKKKSISQSVSQAQLVDQMIQLQQKQQELHKYKHWEDFDRISIQHQRNIPPVEIAYQNAIKISFAMSLLLTNFYLNYFYKSQACFGLYKRYFIPTFLSCMSAAYIYVYGSQVNHIIHNRFFGEIGPQESKYRALDEGMDLYKYVDDIKYNFDYSKSDILKTRKHFHEGYLSYMKDQVKKMVRAKDKKSDNQK